MPIGTIISATIISMSMHRFKWTLAAPTVTVHSNAEDPTSIETALRCRVNCDEPGTAIIVGGESTDVEASG